MTFHRSKSENSSLRLGVSAGRDMTLGAIALMHGVEAAEQVAMWSEYSWHRIKDDDPFAQIYGLV